MIQAKESNIFRIRGQNPICGHIKPQGNKNEALPTIAASLLSKQAITLKNVPNIEDVNIMQTIIRSIGGEIQQTGPKQQISQDIVIEAKTDLKSKLPADLCAQLRGSVCLTGPILARNGEVFLPRPGGDRIGRRRIDTHLLAFQALGAKIKVHNDGFELTCPQFRAADILLDEASVTATENAICAAVMADGHTIIRNAASEPHVQGLCHLLNTMGAHITGIGSNRLEIEGVFELGGASHTIGPDYLEVGSFMSLAALTGGELRIQQVHNEDLRLIRTCFARLGIESHYENNDLIVPASQRLEVVNDLGGSIPRIDSAPWPAFPADMTSVALVTATQCKGTVLIHEKMFESRLFFTDRLIAMGANIVLCDPHRAVVLGPSPLSAAELSSPDIRAGMAMLIAALCAHGESRIQNITQIDRGFARIDERLRSLGADIIREN